MADKAAASDRSVVNAFKAGLATRGGATAAPVRPTRGGATYGRQSQGYGRSAPSGRSLNNAYNQRPIRSYSNNGSNRFGRQTR